MTTDKEQQLEHLREAVDRKSEAALEASHAEHHTPADQAGGSDVQGDEPSIRTPGRTQDAFSPRQKNVGKGKKTADKWNQ